MAQTSASLANASALASIGVNNLWALGIRGKRLIDWCIEHNSGPSELANQLMPMPGAIGRDYFIRFKEWLLISGSSSDYMDVWCWLAQGLPNLWTWIVWKKGPDGQLVVAERIGAAWWCHLKLIGWVLSSGGGNLTQGLESSVRAACARGEYERLLKLCYYGAIELDNIRTIMCASETVVVEWVDLWIRRYWTAAKACGDEVISYEEYLDWVKDNDQLSIRMFNLMWGTGSEVNWQGLEWGGDIAARGYWVVYWQWWTAQVRLRPVWRWKGRRFIAQSHEHLPVAMVSLCRHHFNDLTFNLVSEAIEEICA